MKRPVVFDLDGVLVDFYTGYLCVCDTVRVPKPPYPPVSWVDYDNDKVWRAIRESPVFWEGLPPDVGSRIFDRIEALARPVYFVTSRVGIDPLGQSKRWLISNGIATPSVIVSKMKGEFCHAVEAAYLLDDKAGNAVCTAYMSPRTRAYLLDRPYNQFDSLILGSKVSRVSSVEAFLDIVERG